MPTTSAMTHVSWSTSASSLMAAVRAVRIAQVERDIADNYQPHKISAAAEPDKKYRALWIGGPPGQTMEKLKKKLAAINVIVEKQVYERKIPPVDGYDLILFNVDHMSHNDYYAIKDMAKKAGVPLVSASHNWAKIAINLTAAGFFPKGPVKGSTGNASVDWLWQRSPDAPYVIDDAEDWD